MFKSWCFVWKKSIERCDLTCTNRPKTEICARKNWWISVGVSTFPLGGGFKYILYSPLPGEMMQIDEHMFQMGRFNYQLESRISFKWNIKYSTECVWRYVSHKKIPGGWWVRGESRWRKKTKRSQSEFPQTLNIFKICIATFNVLYNMFI